MKKTFLILSIMFAIIACDEDEKEQAPAPSKKELLTGGTHKDWYVYSSSPEDRCASGVDDTWTFFADGSFAYDHGTITEDEQGECGDLINFEGTWEFSSDETGITVIALRAAGAAEDMGESITVLGGNITTLTNDRMVVTLEDNSASIELRKR
jgi:VCBS repeat-containing protein